jgi:hypothetical protein
LFGQNFYALFVQSRNFPASFAKNAAETSPIALFAAKLLSNSILTQVVKGEVVYISGIEKGDC